MKKFNIRIYGLLINKDNEILVLDETRNGFSFTKFPGGGLEWGEGFEDCLKREFIEELATEIEINSMFYLTEHFVQSKFNPEDQLISIYYLVANKSKDPILQINNEEIPRWIPLKDISEEDVTFPIDKIVVTKLKKEII